MYNLLKVAPYDFKNEKGEEIKGAKITLMEITETKKEHAIGYEIETENISYELARNFINSLPADIKLPVLVDVGYEVKLGVKPKINAIKLSK